MSPTHLAPLFIGILALVACVESTPSNTTDIPKTVEPDCEFTGTSYNCTCPTGYELDGEVCRFIDLCATDNGGCSPNATCTPKIGDRTCACQEDYTGDGITCSPPITTGCGTCTAYATCHHEEGVSDQCVCNPGYTGDGTSCTIVYTAGTVGSDCLDSSRQDRSNCEVGNACISYGGRNMCTKLSCDYNEDCGESPFGNWCVIINGDHRCLRGCDSLNPESCGRSDFVCLPTKDAHDRTIGLCGPACATSDACVYGFLCNSAKRYCEMVPCTTNNTCANPNDVCYSRVVGFKTIHSCIPKCQSDADCPSGLPKCGTDGICAG